MASVYIFVIFLLFTGNFAEREQNYSILDALKQVPTSFTWRSSSFPREEFFQKTSADIIENIGVMVDNLFLHKCLTIIDNIRHVDITNLHEIPTMVRSIIPVSVDKLLMWGPRGLAPRVITTLSRENVTCPLSKYFQQFRIERESQICLTLDLGKFWLNSKPSNCLVQIVVLPIPNFYRIYSKLMEGAQLPSKYAFQSFPPFSVKIFIDQHAQFISSIERMIEEAKRVWLILLFRVEELDKYVHKLSARKALILSVHLVKAFNENITLVHLKNVRITSNSFQNFVTLTKFSLPPPNSRLFWYVKEGSYRFEGVFEYMKKFIKHCSHSPMHHRGISYENPMESVGYQYAQVWKSMMGNYTLVRGHRAVGACEANVKGTDLDAATRLVVFDLHPYVKDLLLFPHVVQDGLSSLYFISCGAPSLTSLPYEELINTYDVHIWGSTILSMAILALLMRTYFRKRQVPWAPSLKVLLEQGNPFPATVTKSHGVRFMVALYLLIGIVLSNAYKNSNVYNMTAPRKIIPYKYFQDLVTANFKIYTRMAMHYKYEYQRAVRIHNMTGAKIKIVQSNDSYNLITSELFALMNAFVMVVSQQMLANNSFTMLDIIQASSIRASGVLANAKFHPSIDKLLLSLNKQNSSVPDITFRTEIFKHIQQEEQNNLLNDLKGCDKVALIVQKDLRAKYWRKLNVETKHSYVFTGFIAHSGIEWMFSFNEGVLPLHLPKQLMGAHESGLWERWTKLVSQRESYVHGKGRNRIFTATSISGNIIVIFMVWMLGSIIAIVSLLAEFIIILH